LGEFLQFECLPELNIFLTMNKNPNDPSKLQITAFRGNKLGDAMRRVLFRTTQDGMINSNAMKFRTYAHFERIVILTFDGSEQILDKIQISTASPGLVILTDSDFADQVGKTVPYTVKVSTSGNTTPQKTFSGSVKVL
jgi:hypothetical protein